MRYDTPVFFRYISEKTYNYDTGDYEPGTVKEVQEYASVENTKSDTLHFVYGTMKEDSLTLHFQNHVDPYFTSIRIGEKIYKSDYIRRLRTKMAIVVSEVKGSD